MSRAGSLALQRLAGLLEEQNPADRLVVVARPKRIPRNVGVTGDFGIIVRLPSPGESNQSIGDEQSPQASRW